MQGSGHFQGNDSGNGTQSRRQLETGWHLLTLNYKRLHTKFHQGGAKIEQILLTEREIQEIRCDLRLQKKQENICQCNKLKKKTPKVLSPEVIY